MVEWLPLDAPAYRASKGHAWTDETLLAWDGSSQLRILNNGLRNIFRGKGEPAHEPELLPSPTTDGAFDNGDVIDEAEHEEIRSNLERVWGS